MCWLHFLLTVQIIICKTYTSYIMLIRIIEIGAKIYWMERTVIVFQNLGGGSC